MSPEEKSAYINSQVTCALITAMGMQAENQLRIQRDETIAYPEKSFVDLIIEFRIGHNDVISFLRD